MNVNLHNLLIKIKHLLLQGDAVKMKNKDKFKLTLIDTRNLLEENSEYLNEIKNDINYSKIMTELQHTIMDTESKLNKLSLIKFCRDRAENYLAQVTEKLSNINLVIVSLLGNGKNKEKDKIDNNLFMGEIAKLNKKILDIEETHRKEDVISEPVYESPRKLSSSKTDPCLKDANSILLKGLKAYLGLEERTNCQKAFEKLTEASEMGNSSAMVMLAKMFEKGEYVDQSYSKAFQLYKEASDLGNSSGSYMIANYAENELIELNEFNEEYPDPHDTAIKNYINSAEQGNSDAFTKLGMIYEKGLLGEVVDGKKSIGYYRTAIQIDENPEALNSIGSIYYKGVLLKQNYSGAVESFQRASKLGNTDAINNLGLCYEFGKGSETDKSKAMKYYKQASEKLHPSAITNQAILLIKLNINRAKKDYKEAFRLLSLACQLDKNNRDGYYYIGHLYENGFGVVTDHSLAYRNYKKAAKLGHTKAKTKVGVVLYNGLDGVVVKDEEAAVQLLNEAANGNEPEALNYLGLIYEKGTKYTPMSLDKCKEYLGRSHSLGYDNASINLALISNQSINVDYPKEKLQRLSKRGNRVAQSVLQVLAMSKESEKSKEKENDNLTYNSYSSRMNMSKNQNCSKEFKEKELVDFDKIDSGIFN